MKKISLAQWEGELKRQIEALPAMIAAAGVTVGEAAVASARAKIGHYQDAETPFPAWAPLAAATIVEKTALGYAPPDNPLLRTGEMRDTISATVVRGAGAGLTVIVGSTDPVAKYQELGAAHLPPRPFLGPALIIDAEPVSKREFGGAMAQTLAGQRKFTPSSE